MLHWQVPKWLSRTSLVTRVIIGSSVLHLLALIAIFVVNQGSSQFHITISGTMINPNSEIVFMPLHRSLQQGGAKSVGNGQSKNSTKSSAAQMEKSKEVSGTTLVKLRTHPSIQPSPRLRRTGGTFTPELTEGSGRAEKKKAQLKKVADKKNEKITQPTPKASDSAKATTDKTAGTEKEAAAKKDSKKIESKSPAKNENVQSKVDKPESKVEEAAQATLTNTNNAISASSDAAVGSSDSVVYVGQMEMDALQAQEYIQQELAQHWAPPSGMRSDLFAIITLTIDFEGAIKKVELTTSSGNLLFDTAAKKAAAQITPARWTFGKELSITFKP